MDLLASNFFPGLRRRWYFLAGTSSGGSGWGWSVASASQTRDHAVERWQHPGDGWTTFKN